MDDRLAQIQQMRDGVTNGLAECDRTIAAEKKRHKERMASLKASRDAMVANLAELDAMLSQARRAQEDGE